MRIVSVILSVALTAFMYPSYADNSSLLGVLGDQTAIVKTGEITKLATLKIAPFNEVRKNALINNNTIAGYPIDQLFPVRNRKGVKSIIVEMLNTQHYAVSSQRCSNSKMYGIRFAKAQAQAQAQAQEKEQVEFTLGLPCRQVTVAFREGGKVKLQSAVLSKEAVGQIIDAIGYSKRKK